MEVFKDYFQCLKRKVDYLHYFKIIYNGLFKGWVGRKHEPTIFILF